jgi:hypothetical protein
MSKASKWNQTTTKIKTFYPFVGGLSDYQKNVTEIFSTIQTRNFTRIEAIEWMMQHYKSSREFCRKLLDMLKSVGLITTSGKRYQLTAPAQQYLETGLPDVLARVFIDNVLGFAEIVNTLAEEGSRDKATFRTEWEAKVAVKLTANQFDHRLNWLRALGYVDIVARNYLLTDHGLKLATEIKQKAATTTAEKQEISHRDLEDRVKVIGEFFEFETTARPSVNAVLPSYAVKLTEGDRQLDCLWVRYVPFGGRMKFPIEIHLTGNLADTIDRLETVTEYVQKAVIITSEDQEKTILDRLKVKKSRLLDKLVIVTVEDVYKAVQAANVLKSFTTKIFTD